MLQELLGKKALRDRKLGKVTPATPVTPRQTKPERKRKAEDSSDEEESRASLLKKKKPKVQDESARSKKAKKRTSRVENEGRALGDSTVKRTASDPEKTKQSDATHVIDEAKKGGDEEEDEWNPDWATQANSTPREQSVLAVDEEKLMESLQARVDASQAKSPNGLTAEQRKAKKKREKRRRQKLAKKQNDG
jgi:hypothetical protein